MRQQANELMQRFGTDRELYAEATKAMEALGAVANRMAAHPVAVLGLLDGFVKEHRTIQQSVCRLLHAMLVAWAEQIAEKPSWYVDGRNEQAAKWAKAVAELDIPMPLI
jgi:hypothetical protein